jgi:plasmid maintenance system antidote protein VapI
MVPVPNGRLWERIRRAGLTQRGFARVVGVHETCVSRVIQGRTILDAMEQERWARALRCRVEDLFSEDRECAA